MRTRLFKWIKGVAGISLLAGGLGLIGGLGATLATGGVAGATSVSGTSPSFLLACKTVTVVGTVTSTTTVSVTLTPSPVTGGGSVALSGLKATASVPLTLVKLEATKHFGVTFDTVAHIATGSPSTVKLTFTVTLLIPPKATLTTTNYPGTVFTVTLTTATATPAVITAAGKGTLTVSVKASTLVHKAAPTTTKYTATKSSSTLAIALTTAGTPIHVGPFPCSNPSESIVSDSITAVPLSITTTSLPAGKVTHSYSASVAAKGGTPPYTWSSTTLPSGLTLNASTGAITGIPKTAGKTTVTFTVKGTNTATATANTASKTLAITIAATTGVPPIRQPFQLTVASGNLTLSCTHDVTSETTAVKTCALIHLSPITLNEKWQKADGLMNTIYVSTARGNPTTGWTLTAVMVPTVSTLNTNTTCASVQGFCDSSVGTHAATATRGQIPATDFAMGNWACKSSTTATYNNAVNVAAKGATGTLKTAVTLCTAPVGKSGGRFTIGSTSASDPAGFQLTVPPYIYEGTYYGTVEYTVISTS